MYNATQFAEFNKANVAQATKIAAIAIENAEKLMKLNLDTAKAAFAQGVEGASAVAAVKEPQEFFALPTKYAESGVQSVVGYSRSLYEVVSAAQAQYSAIAEEAMAGYTKGLASWVEQGQPFGPGRFGRRDQRDEVDRRRHQRRVRPVPEGVEAGREPGRCEPARRRQPTRPRRRAAATKGRKAA